MAVRVRTLEPQPGSYVLWLLLPRACRLQVGRLGAADFESGFYAYVGSAFGPGGVRARLGRHLRVDKSERWHVDYLRAVSRVQCAWVSYEEKRYEHHWACCLAHLSGAVIPLRGFGSSDCDCKTHLVGFERYPPVTEFKRNLPGRPPDLKVYMPDL